MNANEILDAMHSDFVLAQEVLANLRILSPWRRRARPHRGGCEEWERVDIRTERVIAEIYHADWMGEWGAVCVERPDFEFHDLLTWRDAKFAVEVALADAGWRVMNRMKA